MFEKLKEILSEHGVEKEPIFVIKGRQGATGKTHLCRRLREEGFKAYEEWENRVIRHEPNTNYMVITITCDRPL